MACFCCLLQRRHFKRSITSEAWILAVVPRIQCAPLQVVGRKCEAAMQLNLQASCVTLTEADLTLGSTETHLGLAPPNLGWTLEPHPGLRPRQITENVLTHMTDLLVQREKGPSCGWDWCTLNVMNLLAVHHLEKRGWASICLGTSSLAPLPGAHQGGWGKAPFLGYLPRSRSSAWSPLKVTTGYALYCSFCPLFQNLS